MSWFPPGGRSTGEGTGEFGSDHTINPFGTNYIYHTFSETAYHL